MQARRLRTGVAATLAVGLLLLSSIPAGASSSRSHAGDRFHSAPGAPRPADQSVIPSANWSGIADTGGSFSSIAGSWTVPTLSRGGYVGMWIGFGGVSGNLLQIGVQGHAAGSNAVYQAFWEEVPGAQTILSSVSIHAGDSVSASINNAGTNLWTLSLSDSTSSTSESAMNVSYTPDTSTAEWIVEDPACSVKTHIALCPFASFSPVTFSSATTGANVGALSVPYNEYVIYKGVKPQVSVSLSPPANFTVNRT